MIGETSHVALQTLGTHGWEWTWVPTCLASCSQTRPYLTSCTHDLRERKTHPQLNTLLVPRCLNKREEIKEVRRWVTCSVLSKRMVADLGSEHNVISGPIPYPWYCKDTALTEHTPCSGQYFGEFLSLICCQSPRTLPWYWY